MGKKAQQGLPRNCYSFTPITTERQARLAIERESFERPVVVDFFAHWCDHCKDTAPEIDDLTGHVCDAAKVIKVDVDSARKLAAEHNISGLPTVAVFRNGKLVQRTEGYQSAASFLQLLEKSK